MFDEDRNITSREQGRLVASLLNLRMEHSVSGGRYECREQSCKVVDSPPTCPELRVESWKCSPHLQTGAQVLGHEAASQVLQPRRQRRAEGVRQRAMPLVLMRPVLIHVHAPALHLRRGRVASRNLPAAQRHALQPLRQPLGVLPFLCTLFPIRASRVSKAQLPHLRATGDAAPEKQSSLRRASQAAATSFLVVNFASLFVPPKWNG